MQIINFHGLFRNALRCRNTGACRILVPLRYYAMEERSSTEDTIMYLIVLAKMVEYSGINYFHYKIMNAKHHIISYHKQIDALKASDYSTLLFF